MGERRREYFQQRGLQAEAPLTLLSLFRSPPLSKLLQVDNLHSFICWNQLNGPGVGWGEEKHCTETKHLVFKSVLGAQWNELPLIKAQHAISMPVPRSQPTRQREGGGPGALGKLAMIIRLRLSLPEPGLAVRNV